MVAGCGTTDLPHRVAESGATIFLASGERCRSDDRRVQHSEFVDKAWSTAAELGWFVCLDSLTRRLYHWNDVCDCDR